MMLYGLLTHVHTSYPTLDVLTTTTPMLIPVVQLEQMTLFLPKQRFSLSTMVCSSLCHYHILQYKTIKALYFFCRVYTLCSLYS